MQFDDRSRRPRGSRHSARIDEERRRFLVNIITDTHRLTPIKEPPTRLVRAESTPTGDQTRPSPAIADLRRDFPELNIQADGAECGFLSRR
jgi:hypothetical protein